MKRQGHGLLVEIVERLEIAGEARQGRHAVAVNENTELLGRRQLGGKAQAGRVTQRHAQALDHAEAAERAAAFGDDAGFGHSQSQTEPLVGRGPTCPCCAILTWRACC